MPGHHHHHVPHNLHHHHVHRKFDDDTAQPSSQTTTNGPFNTFKFPAIAPTNATAAGTIPHHHHHHHPGAHHHHHPPKTASAGMQTTALRLPTTTILTKPLLQSVLHLPRHHLGSQLYAPAVDVPSTGSTTLGSTITYSNVPNTLPRFEGRENCTYTIRVPRYYLTHDSRENICNARRVWGTDVYTDDSDPVAAAIHSGWIKGAWGADVDVDLLTLDPAHGGSAGTTMGPDADENDITTATTTTGGSTKPADKPNPGTSTPTVMPTKRLTSPPTTGPIDPPENMDMHLTLLILPTLEKYSSSVWHGIKSRSWGRNHDGLSFKIERIDWVDEGVGARGRERGAEARRERMKEEIGGLLDGLRGGSMVSSVKRAKGSRSFGMGAVGMGGLRLGARGMIVAA